MFSFDRLTGFCLILFLLSACGGGSSGEGEAGTQPPPTSTPTYPVNTAVTGSGSGSIGPSSRTISQGGTTTFTIAPATGSRVADVSGCGGSLSGTTYTTGPITGSCTVIASFNLNVYEVSATAGPGGSVTPDSALVEYGLSASFNVIPDEGYTVERTLGCRGSLDGPDYVTGPVSSECAINISFVPQQFSVVLSGDSGGSATGAGVYLYGELATLTATVEAGYDFVGWLESGQLASTAPVYSFAVSKDRNITAEFAPLPDTIVGRVVGFDSARMTSVTLTSVDSLDTLDSAPLGPDGIFLFSGLRQDQQYKVAVSQKGTRFAAVPVTVNQVALADEHAPRAFKAASEEDGVTLPGTELEFHGSSVAGLESNRFIYSWTGDVSVAGYEYSSYINEPLPVEIGAADLSDVDSHSAATLFEHYGILLVDDELTWSPEHATRLLQSMERTGVPAANPEFALDPSSRPYPSRWSLTNDRLPDDVAVTVDEMGDRSVRVSSHAFTYASPVIGSVEGKRGRFFSNRLFGAVVRFVTDHGNDLEKAAEIILRRYGIRIATDEYFDGLYETLPVTEEDRSAGIWQTFYPDEIIELIAMLEEFPDGMKDLSLPVGPGGLRYILRRRDGIPHPVYGPGTTAVAWTSANYIEFLDNAFSLDSLAFIQRLIIHEKAHFLWDYSLSAELKLNWLRQTGWYLSDGSTDGNCQLWMENPDLWEPPNVSLADISGPTANHDHPPGDGEPPLAPGWASCSSTQFPSAYAAAMNPNEDMAESIAYFLTNPDQLRSTSLPKYEFVRDYIMQGSVYVSLFRPDLTFEVLNLYPDYIYPGKINSVEIEVAGAAGDDKQVTITLGLTGGVDCWDGNPEQCFEGASGGFTRIYSPQGTYWDLYFSTQNGAELDNTLIGTITLPSDAAAGWWAPRDIAIFDQAGNRRVQKMTNADFGWQLYINNPQEDLVAPTYVPDSANARLLFAGDAEASPDLLGDERELLLRWRVIEDGDHVSCFSRIIQYTETSATSGRFYDQYGSSSPLVGVQDDQATHVCEIRWRITRYIPSGTFGPGYILLGDRANNYQNYPFAVEHPTYEPPQTIDIYNAFEDVIKPFLNIDACLTTNPAEQCIRIQAEPVRPDNPDGETIVRITYWAYEVQPGETASGVSLATITLRNPQGQEFFWYHGDNSTGIAGRSPSEGMRYFACPSLILEEIGECDATTPIKYEFEVRLPVGSAPGTWGLTEMTIKDRAGNRLMAQFTEVLRFELQ